MIPSKRIILKREGNKSVGVAQRRNKSKIINSKLDSPSEQHTHKHKNKNKGLRGKKGHRDSTPSMDRSSLSPESRLA